MVYSQGAPQQEAADTLGPVDSEPAGFWFPVSEKACWPGSYPSPSLLDCAPFPTTSEGSGGHVCSFRGRSKDDLHLHN